MSHSFLIVKTGEAPPLVKARHGDFEDWIALGLGCGVDDLVVADVYQGETLPPIEQVGGVVVTGSPAMVTERPDWSEAAARWLAELVKVDAAPALGLCYGHQLLAHGLGGEVGTNPRGREMGTVEVTFSRSTDADASSEGVEPAEADGQTLGPLFEDGAFPAHMSHVESVLRPPPGARVLAGSALDPHSVLEFGPRQWGVQFHPEFDRPIMRSYVEARREVLGAEGLDADAMMEGASDTPELFRVLRRFAGLVGAAG